MASKFGLAGGIPERRVRPIWDAVDSRQFKHALKLCVSLLAKYPNSPYALALKVLILGRMGKPDEALTVCLDAKELLFSHNIIPIDDLTLSTLQIVFQRLDRLDMATLCYEHACVKYPNNLEIIMGMFNCYAREYSFVKQQQTSIKMYKIVGEERFLLWAVCSIQLQPELTKKEGPVKKLIERKSLLPRLVYLSTQTASSSLKEVIAANGSTPDTNSIQELKHLLERYAKNIGFSFEDAKTFILEIAKGQKSSKNAWLDFGSVVVDWVNFAIFVNAWNSRTQCSTLPNGDGCNPSSWYIVDNLVRTCVTEQLMCAQPVLTSPGSNLPVLVQLVTESFSWHILVIQSCVR